MEKQLLQQLYQKYQRELFLYLYSLSHNPILAEDLLQETFLKAILSLPDGHPNMRAWLYLVARNLYYNTARKENRSCPVEETGGMENEKEQGLLEQMIQKEESRLLYQALKYLESRKKEILMMQYFGGLSQKEIAKILKLTPENVRVLSMRGKREVRKYMEVNGYDVP